MGQNPIMKKIWNYSRFHKYESAGFRSTQGNRIFYGLLLILKQLISFRNFLLLLHTSSFFDTQYLGLAMLQWLKWLKKWFFPLHIVLELYFDWMSHCHVYLTNLIGVISSDKILRVGWAHLIVIGEIPNVFWSILGGVISTLFPY